LAKFKRLNIATYPYVHYDTLVTDRYTGILVFASIIGYSTVISDLTKEINKSNSVYIEGSGYCRTVPRGYDVEKKSNGDFTHAVITRKDSVTEANDGDERLVCYIFSRNEEELFQRVYDKLYKNTPVPLLQEWMPYIIQQMVSDSSIREMSVVFDDTKPKPFNCHMLAVAKSRLIAIVSNGLRCGAININGRNTVSPLMGDLTGLDQYLSSFGEILASRIQTSFVPKFIPGESEYDPRVNDYDDSCYSAGIEMFEAQKAVVQASVNNLNKNKVTFVIGEMGSGKTLLGSGITYAHHGKNGLTSVILCPSHLTNKWKREVERLVPNGRGYILKSMDDIFELDSKIRNRDKKENTYLIMSKESAKFGYEYRPAALLSTRLAVNRTEKVFVCPECGQPLMKEVFVGEGRSREKIETLFDKRDMSKPLSHNEFCNNEVTFWNKDTRKWDTKKCGTKLWVPLNRDDENCGGWIKLGSEGWIKKEHINAIFNEMISKDRMSRKDSQFFQRLSEKKIELETTGDAKSSTRGPKKYPLAKYIKENYKGYIDYLIGDELHLYKGDTEQGQAFGDLTMVADNIIGLTGTLLNGYADGLFYILYRTLPQLMQHESFEFGDEQSFMRAYGVVRRTNRFAMTNGRQGERIGSGSEKRLPGVSPLVFTKFLLENAVFLSLSDMSEGLPSYEEIPISVPMDVELSQAYNALERELRSSSSWNGQGGVKVLGQLLQTLSVYPDMPYDQPPIIHPDTGSTLVVPQELPRGLRNKEQRLLQLVQDKKANGEKVLVYYHWTNRTDLAEKLTAMFTDHGITSAVMTSKVSADQREQWIADRVEENVDVVICNPTLVETGLDLLDFTTIVFYQMGYNIFTMRQASRRSWRLSQTRPIQVYFMYYEGSIQEQALSLMATKLQASMAIEGRFSEEGLRAMSNNEDLLTQIANNVVNGIKNSVNAEVFKATAVSSAGERIARPHYKTRAELEEAELDLLDTIVDDTSFFVSPTHMLMRNLFARKDFVVNLF
jgi:superfamily II DNA or RNA helicase